MKRRLALLMAFLMSVSLLSGCGKPPVEESTAEAVPIVGEVEQLRIVLPYGAGAKLVQSRSDGFADALQDAMAQQGWRVGEVTLSVAPTQAASGKALDDDVAELVILPANQFFTYDESAVMLMTATRAGISVKSQDPKAWNGSVDAPHYTDEDSPYGRTLICTTKSAKGRAIAESAKNGTLTWEELTQARWMYPQPETASDFIYPDLWLKARFDKTMLDLPDVIPVDGYGALFAEAGMGGADVIVLSADMRIDYAAAWQMPKDKLDPTGKAGLGHEDSIFNEILAIGVTAPIYGDVLTLRADEAPFTDAAFQQALIAAFKKLEQDKDAREIWHSCGYTGFTAAQSGGYDNIREVPILGAGD